MSTNPTTKSRKEPKFKVGDIFGAIFTQSKETKLGKIIKVDRHSYFGFCYTIAFGNNTVVVGEIDLEGAQKFN